MKALYVPGTGQFFLAEGEDCFDMFWQSIGERKPEKAITSDAVQLSGGRFEMKINGTALRFHKDRAITIIVS